VTSSLARWRAISLAAVALVLVTPGTALADPAGPTDFESTVLEIIPSTPALDARIVGGDSFIELKVTPGTEVIVLGYEGEPHLWFRADGTVAENQRSPATYLNRDRYGADVPATADASAEPEWRDLGRGHRWAWHDHRTHLMQPHPPLNSVRGDQVLDGLIPIVIDGSPAEIHVISVWMPAPSVVPALIGVALGIGAVAVALVVGRRMRLPARVMATARVTATARVMATVPIMAAISGVVAAAALVVGAIQYLALPAATDPLLLWWLAPLVALMASVALLVPRWSQTYWGPALLALAGAQLLVWSIERRTGLWRAILPTPLEFWIDRMVTATSMTVGIAAIIIGIAALLGRSRSQPTVPGRSAIPGSNR